MPQEMFIVVFLLATLLFLAFSMIGHQTAKITWIVTAWAFNIIALVMVPLTAIYGR